MTSLTVTRGRQRLLPDARRVLAKPYSPGDELFAPGKSRTAQLLERILAIPEAQVSGLLATLLTEFATRHRAFEELLGRHYELVAHNVPEGTHVSAERRQLIGAYFTHEYAVEGAALFNPSIVLAPNESSEGDGDQRVVLSLRAVGEGHISSIEFRSAVIEASGELRFDSTGPYLVAGQRTPHSSYVKYRFGEKLNELGAGNAISATVLARLPERFSLAELEASLAQLEIDGLQRAIWFETLQIIRVLAASNYVTQFSPETELAERVIFPASPNETRGMEDARFVRFVHDDGSIKYYATYTAYDGFSILPQLIETEDFVSFSISTLNGAAAQNKGMALFPRTIKGQYVMLSRKDRENLFIAVSPDVHFWNDAVELYKPSKPWELLQIGNCGSPLETAAGWLVLTHGVGPMRRYTLGALLLDLDDPTRVIGELTQPLLEPDASEREGYVPNVLYTCGAIIRGDHVILPYGFSDAGIGVARLSLSELLAAMTH
jgi:predicted GH43/DUF377 family glycosyl hydrolase